MRTTDIPSGASKTKPSLKLVLVTTGSISHKVVELNGEFLSREHLCLTVSFDHDIVDGAPAARFMSRSTDEVMSGILPFEAG